jgi:DNA topoisomerase-1
LKKGPYGYYFEWEKTRDSKNKKKPKRLGIPKCIQNPSTLIIEDALKLDSFPLVLSKEDDISLCNGRYGPFIKYGKKIVKVPDPSEFLNIDLEIARKIVAQDDPSS